MLETALNAADWKTRALDARWRLVAPDDLVDAAEAVDVETWWRAVVADPATYPEGVQAVVRVYNEALDAMRTAEMALRPWVIRHVRGGTLAGSVVPRRRLLLGGAIASGDGDRDGAGLPLGDEALLPFLLVARCQAMLGRAVAGTPVARIARATFSEGLCLSFEAYLETRAVVGAGRPLVDVIFDEDFLDPESSTPDGGPSDLRSIACRRALPDDDSFGVIEKAEVMVNRAVTLWKGGEVVVFCFFRRHRPRARTPCVERAAAAPSGASGYDNGLHAHDVPERLALIGDRFEPDRPLGRALGGVVAGSCTARSRPAAGGRANRPRDPSLRPDAALPRRRPLSALDARRGRRGAHAALTTADASGLSLEEKFRAFARFLGERCGAEERAAYLEALDMLDPRAPTMPFGLSRTRPVKSECAFPVSAWRTARSSTRLAATCFLASTPHSSPRY